MKNIKIKISSKKILLGLAICFFIIACVAFFLLYKSVQSKYRNNADKELKLNEEESRRSNMKFVEVLLQNTESERTVIMTHFANANDIVKFLDSIENTGALSHVKLEVSSVEVAKDGSGLKLNVKTTGSFESIYKFLGLIENSSYELEILSLSMQKVDGDSQAESWMGQFQIKLVSWVQ